MNRRFAVKNLVIASGTLISLPFWMQACGVSDTDKHNTSFQEIEQDTLAAVADAVIPAGKSIGALTVGVDKYLQKIFDDCFEKADQDNIKKQLMALDAAAKKTYDKSFADSSQEQRLASLMKLSASAVKEEKDFFDLVKKETINGFNTSQQVMEEYFEYTIAPGHYYGCVNVKAQNA